MTAIDNTPYNKNFLSPLNFVFQIKRAPHVNFFIQKINLPSLTANFLEQGNPFVRIPLSGEHLQFGTLNVTFKVDEDMQNWFEIHNWLRALGFPFAYEEYAAIKAKPIVTGEGLQSDLSLVLLDQVKLPHMEVTFRDALPISLSDLYFDTTQDTVNYITATAQFRYTLYDVVKL
jgi:hypothetical protein